MGRPRTIQLLSIQIFRRIRSQHAVDIWIQYFEMDIQYLETSPYEPVEPGN